MDLVCRLRLLPACIEVRTDILPRHGPRTLFELRRILKELAFDRNKKIFSSRRVIPPAAAGFQPVQSSRTRARWPLAAILSILFAIAGLRYTIHNWHHPDEPSSFALPLLAVAILLAAWNRFRSRG